MCQFLPSKIVLIEDNVDDELLSLYALRGSTEPLCIQVARDGENALRVLQLDKFSANPDRGPDAVITDLKLPGLHGDEIIKLARQEKRFDNVPFVVFSSSDEISDVERCTRFGATAYVQKPIDSKEYIGCIHEIILWVLKGLVPGKSARSVLMPSIEGTDSIPRLSIA